MCGYLLGRIWTAFFESVLRNDRPGTTAVLFFRNPYTGFHHAAAVYKPSRSCWESFPHIFARIFYFHCLDLSHCGLDEMESQSGLNLNFLKANDVEIFVKCDSPFCVSFWKLFSPLVHFLTSWFWMFNIFNSLCVLYLKCTKRDKHCSPVLWAVCSF